jgi:hypothetical protein
MDTKYQQDNVTTNCKPLGNQKITLSLLIMVLQKKERSKDADLTEEQNRLNILQKRL